MNQLSYPLFLLFQAGFKAKKTDLDNLSAIVQGPFVQLNIQSVIDKLSLNPKMVTRLFEIKAEWPESKYKDLCSKHNNKTVNYFDQDYPKLLKELYDPPTILYYQGELNILNQKVVAVVGNRKMTSYGKQVLPKLFNKLKNKQLSLVSGLAYGIDTEAHQIALQNNLPTIAVLGNGLSDDCLYPKDNFNLAKQIVETGGLLISEYPPETQARGYQFVARNRIIAGLAKVTIIIECQAKSGSLITADYALQLGRPILAVPGSILTSSSEGANNLIKQGAHPFTVPEDLADLLEIDLGTNQENFVSDKNSKLSNEHLLVLKYTHTEPVYLEDLIDKTKLPGSKLIARISELELLGIISSPSPGCYIKII